MGRATSMTSPQKKIKAIASSSRPYRRGLLAGLIVIALGGVAVWRFAGRGKSPNAPLETEPKSARIAVVTPQISTNATVPKKVAPRKDVVIYKGKEYPMYDARGGKAYVTGYGVRYHTPHVITSRTDIAQIPWEERPFKRYTDKTIASLLYTEPGDLFIGDMTYGKNFTKQFLKSLKEPIVIDPDDDDETKELKRNVIEVRKELKARHDAGEDVGEILTQTRNQLKELGAYKHELEQQLQELSHKKNMTERDMDDFVAAANQMLESRGCAKITMPEFMRRNLRLREEHYRNLSKANSEKKGNTK